MYTSGCPKNQNICWYITGSPPPAALKNAVPKCLSVRIIVMAPANTGITAIKRYAVINHVQTNKGIFIRVMPGALIFKMVVTMLILPIIEEAPRI